MTSLAADVGVEWLAFRHVSFDLRVTDRVGRIAFPTAWWHNAVGAMLSVDVSLPSS